MVNGQSAALVKDQVTYVNQTYMVNGQSAGLVNGHDVHVRSDIHGQWSKCRSCRR